MPNHFYRYHSRMRPAFELLYHARESFDLAHQFDFSAYSAQHLVDMAVYDQLGGFPARIADQQTSYMDNFRTKCWFRERSRGLTPAAIIQVEVVEDEYYNKLLNISAEYPTFSTKEYL